MQLRCIDDFKLANHIPPAFMNMYDEYALTAASSFLSHEYEVVSNLLAHETYIKNLVVVGSGPGAYLDIALEHDINYIGVDPYFHMLQKNRIYHFNSDFEELERSNLPNGSCLFLFWFNVFHYLKNPHLTLEKLVHPNDLIVHSTWSKKNSAFDDMQKYFKAVYKDTKHCHLKAIKKIRNKNKMHELSNVFNQSKETQVFDNGVNACSIIYI